MSSGIKRYELQEINSALLLTTLMSDPSVLSRVVAADGFACSGKGTIMPMVATQLGYACLDSGSFFRTFAYALLGPGERITASYTLAQCACIAGRMSCSDDGRPLLDGDLLGDLIRSPAVTAVTKDVAEIAEVREALLPLKRGFAVRNDGKVVVEGRDMCTKVFPEARHKFFITAPLSIRARRQLEKDLVRGASVQLAEVHDALGRRDDQDMFRLNSPLRPHPEAVHIDTSLVTITEAVEIIVRLCRQED